ncbi:MAG: hypothetical protein ACI306_08405 [Muribaculaceae bacterium]
MKILRLIHLKMGYNKFIIFMFLALVILPGCKSKSAESDNQISSDTVAVCDATESQICDDDQFPEMQKSAIHTLTNAVEAYEKAHRCALKRFNEHTEQTSKHFASGEVEEFDSDKEQMEYFWKPLDRDCQNLGIHMLVDSLDMIVGVSSQSRYRTESQGLLKLRDSIKEFLSEYDFYDYYHGSEYSLANYNFIDGETIINLENENKMRKMIQEYESNFLKK